MVNRRSEKLDRLLNKKVVVTFKDGAVHEGILEFNRSYLGLNCGSYQYSLDSPNHNLLFFKKTHIKNVREVGK